MLFAKTNMDEFGMGSANAHSAFGAAVNPWTRKYVTDLRPTLRLFQKTDACPRWSQRRVRGGGGERRRRRRRRQRHRRRARLPASYCGARGFKPTYGRVSRWGLVPYCSSLDCPGFLTRTVADAVLMLDATQGRDALDPVTCADARVAALARDVEATPTRRRVEASKSSSHWKTRGRLKRARRRCRVGG